MSKPPDKQELRRQLEQKVSEFLRHGGAIEQVPQGQSGRSPGDGPLEGFGRRRSSPAPSRSPQPPLHDVVQAIEARRRPAATQPAPRPRRRRRQPILDDFGEPVRWVWQEDSEDQ